MTAVILAAGIATRLRPLTNDIPKSLIPVGGKPLLQRNLDALKANNIRRCIIVTGYLHAMIERFVSGLHLEMEIEFIHNPVFEQTNNNYSLWLARPAVNAEEIVLLDADILFHHGLLTRLLTSRHTDALIIRTHGSLGHEEIKCEVDRDGAILKIGKHLDPERSAGESVGIEKFSGATTARLFDVLSRRHVNNEFYEASFQEVIDGGAKIYAVDSGNLPCIEVDTPEDLAAAEHLATTLP
jgi:choline kinase